MSWVAVGVAAVNVGIGVAQRASAKKKEKQADQRSKELFAQRKAYKTPKEVLDLVGISQNRAQTGFDPVTMNYLTSQSDRATAGALGTARQLGANPNDISGILDQSFQNIFKIGSENQLQQMRNFDRLFNSLQLLSNERGAEWASSENMLKDRMQLVTAQAAAAQKEKESGTNLIMSGLYHECVIISRRSGAWWRRRGRNKNRCHTD
jgi:hypothetical protein